MTKDTNIRIRHEDYKILSKLAKKEGRTIKKMFGIAIDSLIESMKPLQNMQQWVNNTNEWKSKK